MSEETMVIGPRPVITALECKACGRCVAVCPKKCLALGTELNARGYKFVQYSGEGCVGCASCFYACPEPNAIEIHIPIKEPAAAKSEGKE